MDLDKILSSKFSYTLSQPFIYDGQTVEGTLEFDLSKLTGRDVKKCLNQAQRDGVISSNLDNYFNLSLMKYLAAMSLKQFPDFFDYMSATDYVAINSLFLNKFSLNVMKASGTLDTSRLEEILQGMEDKNLMSSQKAEPKLEQEDKQIAD